MEKLTDSQKKLLVEYMKDHEDFSWNQHSAWATSIFRVIVTPDECNRLFIQSMFE